MKFTKDRIIHKIKCFRDKIYWEFYWPYIGRPFISVVDFFRYDVPQGTKSLWRWFPIIWSDRNWDFTYLEYIIKHKLTLMSDSFEKYNNHENTKQYVKEMRQCIRLIDRIHYDNYGYLDKHNEKWGEIRIDFEPTYDETGDIAPDRVRSTFYRKNVHGPLDKEFERKEYMIAHNKEEEQRRNDYKALFGIMAKRNQYWWD